MDSWIHIHCFHPLTNSSKKAPPWANEVTMTPRRHDLHVVLVIPEIFGTKIRISARLAQDQKVVQLKMPFHAWLVSYRLDIIWCRVYIYIDMYIYTHTYDYICIYVCIYIHIPLAHPWQQLLITFEGLNTPESTWFWRRVKEMCVLECVKIFEELPLVLSGVRKMPCFPVEFAIKRGSSFSLLIGKLLMPRGASIWWNTHLDTSHGNFM